MRGGSGVLTLEVADLENGRAGLGGGALEFGAVDFDEALAVEELAEEVADPVLELEHGLVRLCPEVDDTVVQARVKKDALELDVLRLGLRGFWSVRIVDGERQNGLESGDEVQLSALPG